MKTIVEILGGAQMLLGISFDIQDCFEHYLTEEHRAFLHLLRIVEAFFPRIEKPVGLRGRRPFENTPFLRAYLAKAFFKIETTSGLRNRLLSDSSLRNICGLIRVPSPATFSRRLKVFADHHLFEQILYPMVADSHAERLVGHISRDSTAISAREKPVNTRRDVTKPKQKRGRPRKGEVRPNTPPSRLTRQISCSSGKAVKDLNRTCAWGCKKNSQGNLQFWKGYKLHLDITDRGIPTAAVVTGANVHDSQVALPLEKLTERHVTHLYSVMDSAYDALAIRRYSEGQGRVALIDRNTRRGDTRPPMDPAEQERFKVRSTVERANAHLKDWLLPQRLLVRGYAKVNFTVMTGVVCLAALKVLQYFIIPTLDSTA